MRLALGPLRAFWPCARVRCAPHPRPHTDRVVPPPNPRLTTHEWISAWLRTPWPPLEGGSARWLARGHHGHHGHPLKEKLEKKIHGECPLVNTPTPPSCETFLSLDRGVAMVAMVARSMVGHGSRRRAAHVLLKYRSVNRSSAARLRVHTQASR